MMFHSETHLEHSRGTATTLSAPALVRRRKALEPGPGTPASDCWGHLITYKRKPQERQSEV